MTDAAALEAAFAEVNRQLDAKGLIVRKGTLLDIYSRTVNAQEPLSGVLEEEPAVPEPRTP